MERCIDDELLFEIPDSWEWVRLGTVLEIARGGSPRPIQQYLTTEPDGINWIKIGDTDKGGKYIYKTKEKIRPEGVAKSRMVHSGDFLLTNSMSFGRPYILKSDGCIHDGWLVLSNRFECYSVDFLYYILSSPFAYYQFCDNEALSWLNDKHQESGFIFLNKYGDRITTRGISGQLKKLAVRYGIDPVVVYPHSFRHRFAKSFLERCNDIAFLADLMGHESIETTRIYLRKTSTEQRAIVDEVIDW